MASASASSSSAFSTYLSAAAAADLDRDLMDAEHGAGFSLDQLMELAGLAVAQAVCRAFPSSTHARVLVACGPGNNGGDGLVAARHLALAGYDVEVCYPVRSGREPHYARLVRQLEACGVPVSGDAGALPRPLSPAFDVVVDAVFGFSFSPDKPMRPPFDSLIEAMTKERGAPPVVSVDVPSGWSVDGGPAASSSSSTSSSTAATATTPAISPAVLVSLTAPKPGAARHLPEGCRHFVGGRFVPPALALKYSLKLAEYPPGGEQVVEVENERDSAPAPPAPPPPSSSSVGKLDVAGMRLDYGSPEPLKADSSHAGDPMVEFDAWFRAAASSLALSSSTSGPTSPTMPPPPPPPPPEPNAMCLATATADGSPSARMVLMKGYDERGISFYTHFASRKGVELESGRRRAALVFHWPHLVRSVRFEGPVERVPDEEADAYFASRPRGSQVGAHASEQSRVLPGGAEELAASAAAAAARFADEATPVPRPEGWGGFRVAPDRVEFWTGKSSRLHDRVLYTKQQRGGEGEGGGWTVERLAP